MFATEFPNFAYQRFLLSTPWIIFGVVVLLMALISAFYHNKRGYFFWRTFILAIMGFGGLGLFMLNIYLKW